MPTKEFSRSIDVHAPAGRVWSVVSDVERWHEWTPSISSIERLEDGPLRIGSSARVRQPKLRPAVWHVTELEEGRGFTWKTKSSGVRSVGGHWIQPSAGGCRVVLSLRFSGLLAPIVSLAARGLIERYLSLEANGLKQRAEAQSG
jgi:uncharacterized membrane protein